MGYFAARSAPFGVVPTEVVTAAFYNFAPERVAKALPAAWDVASPADTLRAREESAVAALRRYGVDDDDEVRAAADLAAKVARGARTGRSTIVRGQPGAGLARRTRRQAVARRHTAARTAR